MSGGGRKLNPLEQKLHQAALADPKKTVTQKECDVLVTNPSARLQAINFLLGTGLWKALKDTSGNLSYRVVTKKELEVKKDMSGEEGMILSYIQSVGNEGIWTKHLKAKTELHQTVIDRCIKSLMQKQLIKAVKSVKYPTRKIYMLYHLEPSVEMTGGPWYTDNELDTEFIKLLCSASLRFIRDRSTPKQKGSESSADQPLYPISAAPAYPTTQQVLTFLSKSRITETQLSVEHVEMLLNVLVLDGEIERLPAFGAAMWDASQTQGDNGSDSEREDGRRAKEKGKEKDRKRKRKEREDSDSPKRDRKRNKRSQSPSSSESESESDSDDSDDERERRRKKDKKRKNRSRAASRDEDVSRESRKRKKRSRDHSEDEDAEGDVDLSDVDRKSKSKGKKRKRSRLYSSESGSDSDDDSDDDRRSRSRSKSKSKSGRKRSSSRAGEEDVTASLLGQDYGAHVYRAVRQERAAGGGGGLGQTPCVRCSVFDFCKDGGPVNARECEYYGSWLVAADVAKG